MVSDEEKRKALPQWERTNPKHSLDVRCPVCGYVTDWRFAVGFDYCPRCGTRMHNFDGCIYKEGRYVI